ncbi:MAG: hypothetical protein JWM53_3794 [bacterium]|nr:hypothetical protein [bacterium]
MARNVVPILALATCLGSGCLRQGAATTNPDAGVAFQADGPTVYVAKVKNILVGLPPSDDEIAQVTADPSALGTLIDGWMATPEYQAKMMVFFELAFQQTQITAADFTDMIPPTGLGVGGQIPLLLQNLRESFARTALSLVMAGRPISDAFTTKQLMMTPALMELYAFLDTRHVDDNAKITDAFTKGNPTLMITLEAAQGPIAITDTLNPASPNYMHWYNPSIGKLTNYPDQTCNVDPIQLPADSYGLHLLLYGGVFNHRTPLKAGCPTQTTTGFQMQPTDFTTWKPVTIRAPKSGEATSVFYDLPTLRAASELVLGTPHPGFFTTPAFAANWPTNTSNQMRVTINQTLIVATGMAIDGNDTTSMPTTATGMDLAHAAPGSPCFGCHQVLDPTRAMLQKTYSYYYYPQSDTTLFPANAQFMFAFQNVIKPIADIDDFAATLASHPAVPTAWAQKLCYWVNSSACTADDPEFQRVVGVFAKSNLSWNALVRELMTSPIVTNTAMTRTATINGEVIAVTRRDHLCAALDNRLGLVDVCGLDANVKRVPSTVATIVGGLPSDGYGRGSPIPVLPNQPTLFYRAGLENICESVAAMVIDAKANPQQPNAKQWSSSQPDAAIADFVSTVMALTSSDARAAGATSILRSHFDAAGKQGASPSDALKSTFVTACLAPSSIGIGM